MSLARYPFVSAVLCLPARVVQFFLCSPCKVGVPAGEDLSCADGLYFPPGTRFLVPARFPKTPRARQDADAVTSALVPRGQQRSSEVKVLDHHGYFKVGTLARGVGPGPCVFAIQDELDRCWIMAFVAPARARAQCTT